MPLTTWTSSHFQISLSQIFHSVHPQPQVDYSLVDPALRFSCCRRKKNADNQTASCLISVCIIYVQKHQKRDRGAEYGPTNGWADVDNMNFLFDKGNWR